MAEQKHTLTYEGNISDDLRSFMCSTLKQSMEDNMPEAKRVNKLVGFALELLDNAQRYGNGTKIEFEWTSSGNELTVTVKNLSNMQNAKRLKDTVDHVAKLNSEGLVAEYRTKMLDNKFNESGGAGLGFLQMAKNGAKDIKILIEDAVDGMCICSSTIIASIDGTDGAFNGSAPAQQ